MNSSEIIIVWYSFHEVIFQLANYKRTYIFM